VTFASALTAGPAVANPGHRIARVASPFPPGLIGNILPSLTTFYDVSAYTGVILSWTAQSGWAANTASFTPAFADENQAPLVTSNDFVTSFSGSALAVYYRTSAPFMQIVFTNYDIISPGAVSFFDVWGTNATQEHDGPVTITSNGTVLAAVNQAFAAGATVTVPLGTIYTGGAFLTIDPVSNAPASAWVTRLSDGATVGGVAASATISSVNTSRLWVPPEPCSVTFRNFSTSAAQTIRGTLVTAA
jgi:hypothetical protein